MAQVAESASMSAASSSEGGASLKESRAVDDLLIKTLALAVRFDGKIT
jgi:hypothetical protein